MKAQKLKANDEAFEAMKTDHMPDCIPSEKQEFETGYLGFSIKRRSTDYRRELLTIDSERGKELMKKYPKMCDEVASTDEQRNRILRLVSTWADVFCENVKDMPKTDLVEHRIPTYRAIVPKAARSKLYTKEEVK